jgi:hypothetical protein
MKNIIKFFFLSVAITLILPSCSKDSNQDPKIVDNLIGEWKVVRADATAYIDGIKLEGITVETNGTLKFDSDGSGRADFSMSFLETNKRARGNFTWERSGFEVLISMDGETLRYASIVNDPDYQELQVTYEEKYSSKEVEFNFIMERKS